MKICRMMLYSEYISDEKMLKAIENSFNHIHKNYICVYEKNFNHTLPSKLNIELLNEISLKYKNTEILVIKEKEIGANQEDKPNQVETKLRNHILKIATTKGNDFIYLQDIDEFLFPEDYEWLEKMYLPDMRKNDFVFAAMKILHFWKNKNYILTNDEEKYYDSFDYLVNSDNPQATNGFWQNFIIDLTKEVVIENISHIDGNKYRKSWILEDRFIYHSSFTLNDQETKKKISTWGHSADTNFEEWYEKKWLNWNPETTDLHPSATPHLWKKAISFKQPVPREFI